MAAPIIQQVATLALCLLTVLILTFSTTTSHWGPSLVGASDSRTQLAPNILLFSGSDSLNQNRTHNHEIEDLLRDHKHDHMSDKVNLDLSKQVWALMRQKSLEYAKLRVDSARPEVLNLLSRAKVSNECFKSIDDVMQHIKNLDQWAFQMYNAIGDFPPVGLFEGSLTSMGSYQQCVELEPNQYIGSAKYCTFNFQPVIPKRPKYHNLLATIQNLANFTTKDDMFYSIANKAQYFYYTKLRLTTCMPSRCSQQDIESLGQEVAVNSYLQFAGASCLKRRDGFKPDGAQIFAISVLVFMASISFLGTLVHLFNLHNRFGRELSSPGRGDNSHTRSSYESPPLTANGNSNHVANDNDKDQKGAFLPSPVCQPRETITSGLTNKLSSILNGLVNFSVIKNGRSLFDTTTSRRNTGLSDDQNTNGIDPSESKSASVISCVHGLRFWTISWIILGHTMQYTEWAGFARAYQVEENITSLFLHPVLNATYSVDTFFLMSGLLTTYVTWSITKGQYRRFNKFAFLISRYLRLTPQVLIVMLMFIIFPMMGDGPYWRGLIQKESDNCKANWWVSALFLQSFYRQDKICNLVTWWLSIEMFYHMVSIFVIIALLKGFRGGMVTLTMVGAFMTAISCYLHYANHYPPNMLPTLLQRYEIWDSIVLKYFWTPWPHAPGYFVGLGIGYLLSTRTIGKLNSKTVRYGWIAFAICYLGILFGTYGWNRNSPYSRITATVYYNTSQVLWAFATGWAILACAMGHGGWLNSFLSSPVFVPLGRATYMTYLSHMIVVMSYPAKMNTLIEPSYVVFSYIFISNLVLAYSLGIFLTIVYESPILQLQKKLVEVMSNKYNSDQIVDGNDHDEAKEAQISLTRVATSRSMENAAA